MEKVSLNEFFVPVDSDHPDDERSEDVVILLNFQYGGKAFATVIDFVKEIVDFPVFVPFPHQTDFLGVFNLRGSIVPIFSPLLKRIPEQHHRQRLIVFEVERGELVAVPASSIIKKEVDKSELMKDPNFVTIDDVPLELFDINMFLKEAV